MQESAKLFKDKEKAALYIVAKDFLKKYSVVRAAHKSKTKEDKKKKLQQQQSNFFLGVLLFLFIKFQIRNTRRLFGMGLD